MAINIMEALLFVDDSAVVKFDDDSFLQISSCGSVFRSRAGAINDSGKRLCETQQLSQFTTTLWKERVQLALEFRNKFAELPYLCRHLLENDIFIEKKEGVKPVCTWPRGSRDIKTENIAEKEDGSFTLKSLEGNASIILSSCRQIFTVKFLCQVQTENKGDTFMYSWIQQLFSVQQYPHCFNYPLHILLNEGIVTTGESTSDHIMTEIPQSLPLHCKMAHMHRWRKHDILIEGTVGNNLVEMEPLKVLFSGGIFYRFSHGKYFTLEAILSDDSVIRSEGPTQLYFKHWFYDYETSKVRDEIYSLKAPPLDKKGQTFSVSKIIKTSARYLNYLSYHGRGYYDFTCCWKTIEDPLSINTVPDLQLDYSIYIPGQGTFKTYTNGRMHIIFSDGCIMDMMQPVERSAHQDMFSIILPNGMCCKGSLKHPSCYQRYVDTALEYIQWRHQQADTTLKLDNAHKSSLVVEELKKLRIFNNNHGISRAELQNDFRPKSNSCLQDTVEIYQKDNILNCSTHNALLQKENDFPLTDKSTRFTATSSPLNNENTMQQHLQDNQKKIDEIESVLENCKRHLKKS